MPYSILLIVKIPEKTENTRKDEIYEANYRQCLFELQQIASQNKGIEWLGQGALRFQIGGSLKGLSDVVRKIGSLPYTYTISPDKTEWHEVKDGD